MTRKCALLPLLYTGPATALHGLWLDQDSPTYMHGYLLLLVSAVITGDGCSGRPLGALQLPQLLPHHR